MSGNVRSILEAIMMTICARTSSKLLQCKLTQPALHHCDYGICEIHVMINKVIHIQVSSHWFSDGGQPYGCL